MDFPLRATKDAMLRKPALRQDLKWARPMIQKSTVHAAFQIRAWAWPWDMRQAKGCRITGVYPNIPPHGQEVLHPATSPCAKEVHMRIACPPLIYGCRYVGFTSSKSDMELLTRRIIEELEGAPDRNLDKYATTGSPQYCAMVEKIRERFGLTSLKFNTIETLIESIGLPKCKVCTHCFDGSSHF